MAQMTKRVNVKTTVAVRNTNPPIHGTYTDIVMTTGDILKCLCRRAKVEEILPDGSTVQLNMKNYYLDNGAGLDASIYVKKKPTSVNHTMTIVARKKDNEKAHKSVEAPETPVEVAEEQPTVHAGTEVESTNSDTVTADKPSYNSSRKKNRKKKTSSPAVPKVEEEVHADDEVVETPDATSDIDSDSNIASAIESSEVQSEEHISTEDVEVDDAATEVAVEE